MDKLKIIEKKKLKENILILKIQHSFKSKAHNPFTEEVNNTKLIANDDTRM